MTFFAFAVPAVLFAGISKGGFASGAAFAAAPFLALILEPAAAVGLMLPLLMLMDLGALKAYWRKWDWPASRALILGSVPGIASGAVLVSLVDPDVFRLLIGLIAIGFVVFQASRRSGSFKARSGKSPLWLGYPMGALAGLTSFIAHAGGPPAAVFMLSRQMTKTGFQATSVLVFSAINLLKFVPFVALGMITPDMTIAWLVLAPLAFFGIWLGVLAHNVVSEAIFFRLTYLFLVVTGTKLIWDALT